MTKEVLQRTDASFWSVWKRPIIFLLVGGAIVVVLFVLIFSKVTSPIKEYYPQTITEVTTRVLNIVDTVSLQDIDNLSEIEKYCSSKEYEFLQFSRVTMSSLEYDLGYHTWETLPAEIKDYSELKQWLKETGYTSTSTVLSVQPTKYTDPNEAEAIATVMTAIYTKEQNYINQFKRTFLVTLVRGAEDQAYWVVDDISPYVPIEEETSAGS